MDVFQNVAGMPLVTVLNAVLLHKLKALALVLVLLVGEMFMALGCWWCYAR